MIFPGWTIARAIPYSVWAGLLTGQYKITGGVIRKAAGSPQGGQIIRHLLPATLPALDSSLPGVDLINTYQLFQISRKVTSLTQVTQHVLTIATGTAMLSGLNLLVSSFGFIMINRKLNAIDERLKAIQRDVQAIRIFLESAERARLYAALRELSNLDDMKEHRDPLLRTARTTLLEIHMKYKELFGKVDDLELTIAYEEYFSLTALALAYCTAELRLLKLASKELGEAYLFWKEHTRQFAKDILIGQHPERFLASDFAQVVPVNMLVEWLDFSSGEEKGYIWLDEIRKGLNEPWYGEPTNQSADVIGGIIDFLGMGDGQTISEGKGLNRNIGVGMVKEREVIIPTLQKFIARNTIFEGYLAQYHALESYMITPSELEQKRAEIPASSAINGCFILEPEKQTSPEKLS